MPRQLTLAPAFAASIVGGGDTCSRCPLNDGRRQKVLPTVPDRPRLGVVGLGSGLEEQKVLSPFVGEGGRVLRGELSAVGFRAGTVAAPRAAGIDVAYFNLTRCRPDGGDFDGAAWREAAQRCWAHLSRDIAGEYPLLLLGGGPLRAFIRDSKASVARSRGLWLALPGGRAAFAVRHPASFFKVDDADRRREMLEQFRADLARCAARILGTEPTINVKWLAYPNLPAASRVLAGLAKGVPAGRWAFDIETFDAAAVPSRVEVATDPFHPDFRVRGVAAAVGPRQGFWVELAPHEGERGTAVTLPLAGAFASGDEKEAFFGSFDENGLVAPGWVPAVRNRTRDPFLAAQALDASGLTRKSLAALAVDVLGEPQPVGKDDRGMIRDMPLMRVAEYAVRDACLCWRLGDALRGRLARGEYL